ncbi:MULTISPECIES: DUF2061 domain-containing protein [Novosphingobium]|jgi:uncharacterized membrane protein|uniref:DUF2061 domain-containing protein n=1 Tax=Novosphingobium subterraneum TaxID=48936 RepID=A0A0B9A2E2_9SPHN|nr:MULTISPECIES: DUF2061 domain-containing protein [Novosphingobium]KHS43467.1 hypothetical protein NJ75_03776 [Novosphingobium subterraneum]QOV94060.1 DUF2061 domain-containing protein [Novosphingobium sp. ES2-1]
MILFHGHEAHARSIVKAISWRTLGSIDTFLLGWLFTGSMKAAGAIAGTEVITKIGLYYFHERVWSSIHWGTQRPPVEEEDAAISAEAGLV